MNNGLKMKVIFADSDDAHILLKSGVIMQCHEE